MRGDSIIAIDNCEIPLEGVLLNQALTQPRVELRILGKSKMVTTRCAAQIAANGNNLVVRGDLTRRSVIGRLDPKVARPELLQFKFDPIDDAKKRRGELVVAALTVLRADRVAGLPKKPPRLQSFEQWSDTVRCALIWLGAGDPVATMDRMRKIDPALRDLRMVVHAWRAGFGLTAVTARWVIDAAEETVTVGHSDEHKTSFDRPHLRDALMAVAGRGGRLDSRALGAWLTKQTDRVVDLSDDPQRPEPFVIEAAGDRQGVTLWKLVRRVNRGGRALG
jgi:hypothetical protein